MKYCRRIISFFAVFATFFSIITVPVHAVDVGIGLEGNITEFFDWAYGRIDGNIQQDVNWWKNHLFDSDVCPQSRFSDGRHSFVQKHTQVNGKTGNYYICEYCGKSAGEVGSGVYSNVVGGMITNGVTSEGKLLWYPTGDDLVFDDTLGFSVNYRSSSPVFDTMPYLRYEGSENSYLSSYYLALQRNVTNGAGIGFDLYPKSQSSYLGFKYSLKVPSSGTYLRTASRRYDIDFTYKSGDQKSYYDYYYADTGTYKKAGETVTYETNGSSTASLVRLTDNSVTAAHGIIHFPVYELILDDGSGSSGVVDMPQQSRPASIEAPVTYFEDNSDQSQTTTTSIVNETDNSVYNPVTNNTMIFAGWTYDYSTRTYTFYQDNSSTTNNYNTTTVNYGDEYITIIEGDTVNNTYNTYYIYYYLPDNSGDTPSEPGTNHKHNYTREITREATCTTSGLETYTCSDCGDTYTKVIAALGHDWVIKEQVPTEYDESGEPITQGYTIYRCTRCNEEYKSTDGKAPDSGGSDSSSLWAKIGELLGSAAGGLLGLLGSFLSAILTPVISLAETIGGLLGSLVEMVLGWFESIPQMFTGFLAFLSAIFPFLPPEVTMLLTFGLAAVVFIGIIKAIRR